MNREEHVNKVKDALETMIGTGLSLKKKKTTYDDIEMQKFIQIITLLEQADNRANIMENEFGLDLSKYDDVFYDVIDELIIMQYGKPAAELVFFYLYERRNPSGDINELMDEAGNTVSLNNPSELWELIQEIKNRVGKAKKK